MQRILLLSLAMVFFWGCSKSDSQNPGDPTVIQKPEEPSVDTDSRLIRTSVLSGLQDPWDMAFAPDGSLFFTEKCRGLSVRKTDGSIVRLFGTDGASVSAGDLLCDGESGMLGVAVHPAFENNRTIYLYMLSDFNSKANVVVRLKVDMDYTTVSDRVDIVTEIPFKRTASSWGNRGTHSGGRLHFGPDGFLYIATGDNVTGTIPQDLKNLGGKVLRVTEDGGVVPENNMPEGADPRIFTYGHRNIQGLTFHPQTGQPFVCEAGPNHSDEVTGLLAGKNGGWDPLAAPGAKCADDYCGDATMTDLAKFPEALRPVASYSDSDSPGIGTCTFLKGERWKAWEGSLVVGMLSGERLDIIHFNSGGSVQEITKILLPTARMRAVVEGPDNNLYIATEDGEVWMVAPR